MKVIIPVAGAGTRLRPHTYSQPKPLLHVAGRAMIDHILDPVVKIKPDEVVFVVGFLGDQIEEHIRQKYQFAAKFVSQNQLLGLGYALDLALQSIQGEEILIILGDTIVDFNLQEFISAGDYVLGLRQVDDPHRFGIAEIKNGHIVGLEEKPETPKGNLAVIGLYYFRDARLFRKVLSAHVASGKTTRGEIQLTDALQDMIRQGTSFTPYQVNDWYDCGKKETVLSTNRHLLTGVKPPVSSNGSSYIPPVYIDPTAKIKYSVLGPNVSVSANAVITSSVIRNSIVGADAVIENMIIEDSIIGQHAVVRNEAKVLNVGDSSEISQR
jgi:glucose-1-phosphate thymidylyltransferase